MNVYTAFEVDKSLVKHGIWFDIHTPDMVRVARFKCRPAEPDLNSEYQLANTELLLESNGKKDDLIAKSIKVFARSVVVDWELTDRENKPVKCTEENVELVFTQLPMLFVQVYRMCQDWTRWRLRFVEQAVGN